jgi:DNA-binding NtrC family response regulator
MKILIVDDEVAVLNALQRVFRKYRDRWELHFAAHAAAALEVVAAGGLDIIISDMRMPGADGLQLLEAVRTSDAAIYRILMSGALDPADERRARALAHEVLEKPCPSSQLVAIIEGVEELVHRATASVADVGSSPTSLVPWLGAALATRA